MQGEVIADLVVLVLGGLWFGLFWWMPLDVLRRGRSGIRWQLFLFLLPLVAVPVWLYKRRRIPITTAVSRRTKVAFAIAAAALVVLPEMIGEAVTTYYFQVARVEGSSMAPTLFDQDRLVVNKRAYRMGEPVVGDIVMLRYPLDPVKAFVMRVIAVGGDEVRVVDGTVYRNGEAADEPFVDADSQGWGNWGPEVMPIGSFFVMGDRRNNSSDSRHWGPVSREHMVGKVTARWWPLSRRRSF